MRARSSHGVRPLCFRMTLDKLPTALGLRIPIWKMGEVIVCF